MLLFKLWQSNWTLKKLSNKQAVSISPTFYGQRKGTLDALLCWWNWSSKRKRKKLGFSINIELYSLNDILRLNGLFRKIDLTIHKSFLMTKGCKMFPNKSKINYFIKVGNHCFKGMKKSLFAQEILCLCVKVIIMRKFFLSENWDNCNKCFFSRVFICLN